MRFCALDAHRARPYGPPAFEPSRDAFNGEMGSRCVPPEPDDLKRLGERIDEAERKRRGGAEGPPPSPFGIAFRFATEMVTAVVVGGGLGWSLDWALEHWASIQSRPWGMVVFVVLGAAAGIRNVMRAASEINAGMASKEK
jgi:ATP synthase protein I